MSQNFEEEIIDIVGKLKFRKDMNNFQSKLKEDMKTINDCNKTKLRICKEDYEKKLSRIRNATRM